MITHHQPFLINISNNHRKSPLSWLILALGLEKDKAKKEQKNEKRFE